MKLDLKQENINSLNYFQSNLFLNEVDAKFVYGIEKIIEKDKLYSIIREVGDINFNYVTRKKIFIENKYIYNAFIKNTNILIKSINKKDIIRQLFLENNKLPDWEEFAQSSKWINSNEADLKRGSVFIKDSEIPIFKKEFIKQIKIKNEFINSHIFMCLASAWRFHFKYKKLDFKELFFISMEALYNSIDEFIESLNSCKKENLDLWENGEVYSLDKYQKISFEPISNIEFDSCFYSEDFIDIYFDFIENAQENIDNHILNYLINKLDFCQNRNIIFENKYY